MVSTTYVDLKQNLSLYDPVCSLQYEISTIVIKIICISQICHNKLMITVKNYKSQVEIKIQWLLYSQLIDTVLKLLIIPTSLGVCK